MSLRIEPCVERCRSDTEIFKSGERPQKEKDDMETIYRITNALGELEIGIDVPEEGNALIVEVQEDGGISTVWLTLEDVQKLYESLGAWLRSA